MYSPCLLNLVRLAKGGPLRVFASPAKIQEKCGGLKERRKELRTNVSWALTTRPYGGPNITTALEAVRLGTPPVGKVYGNVGSLKYLRCVSDFGFGPGPDTNQIADQVLTMVRCRDSLRGKALWCVPSYTVCFSSLLRWAPCSSWARPLPMNSRTIGPPARFMRTIRSLALRTANRKRIRENRKSLHSRRETHFASFISHGPVSWIAPPVRGQTSHQICSAPRLFPSNSLTHDSFRQSRASQFVQEHERGLL